MARIGASGTGGADNGGSGSGNVTGIPPTRFDSITRWADTVGQTIKDSNTLVQDGGAVQTQMFVFNRQILNDVFVPDHYSAVSSEVELVSGDIYLLGDSTLILV